MSSELIPGEATGKNFTISCTSGLRINITNALYGSNCPAANGGVQDNNLFTECDEEITCTYTIDYTKIGDPASGCFKDYIYNYTCVEYLFVIPPVTGDYSYALNYCQNNYHDIANIYDPNENDIILKTVNLRHIDDIKSGAFIGYHKEGQEWEWESDFKSNPMLFLQSPLTPISSNIETPLTTCMVISRFGWLYQNCSTSNYFVCETKDHRPKFNESGPFRVNTERKLKFNDARSLCRAHFGYDLATIYEEQEYRVAQDLCKEFSKEIDQTNCWIGFEKGILNVNEWEWVQDLPPSVIPINELINIDLWTIEPFQKSIANVYCQARTNLTILYDKNGEQVTTNQSGEFHLIEPITLIAKDVTYDSTLTFRTDTVPGFIPGLRCSVIFENNTFNTEVKSDDVYWSIIAVKSKYESTDILEQTELVTKLGHTPDDISPLAQWLWNHFYLADDNVTEFEQVTFQFSFEQVPGVQLKPGDNCAAISYFEPNKWKTNNCEDEQYFICNAYDHAPKFAISDNNEFAVLINRTLTRPESLALCQNIYGDGLATIYSHYEFNQITDMLNENGIDDAWIGLHYNNKSFQDTDNWEDVKSNYYGWDTQTEFIFDDWTLDVWENGVSHAFPTPSVHNDSCVKQTNEGEWELINCTKMAHAVCNYKSHEPQFKSSQLGAFYLLENQLQNYKDGEQMCKDYVGYASTGAIIYHPIENERAIWLCSNSTNGKGCFIGYNNLKTDLKNNTIWAWNNGAKINIFDFPWFGNYNPWLDSLNITNKTQNIDELLTNKYGGDTSNTSYCTAIIPANETIDGHNVTEWKWDIVDCDPEGGLNMLCDSGEDHAQCWMIQSCSECAVRSDCGWCAYPEDGRSGKCQLKHEICYAPGTEFIKQEFGCPDYDPIINVTMKQDYKYEYYVNITMCAQTAPDDVPTHELINYVNHSHCVKQQEKVELYVISDYENATLGNFQILGRVIELNQTSQTHKHHWRNSTIFDQTVCEIDIYHGYVNSIKCDTKAINNLTQFDMLHDILRYLIPRLETRLFQGFDIAQESLFGYSTMQRYHNGDVDHTIHRV